MGRVLGIDYGERRVGIASGDTLRAIATPMDVLDARNERDLVAAIRGICVEWEVAEIVVGLPVNMDGSRGPSAIKTEAFASRLAQALGLPVRTWDERLTTQAAERSLLEADLSRAKRRRVRDKIAAQVMLQGYLDASSSAAGAAPVPDAHP